MARVHKLSAEEHGLVSDAVGQAERGTSGEIVTIVADQSDGYTDIAWALSGFIALLALAVYTAMPHFYMRLVDAVTGGWRLEEDYGEYMWVVLILVTLKFFGSYLLLLWRPLRLFLTPRPILQRRVRDRAVTLFRVGAERRTQGRTGILIYLSLAEHRAEIIADEAIAGKVAPEAWGEAMAAMLAHIREGRTAEGMAAAVEKVGTLLAIHFPAGTENPNELPDRLIEL